MNAIAKLFDENFTTLATSAEGIDKLRELILQLAVRGKLVPQDHNDEPASSLFEKIKAERQRYEKAKKIRKEKTLPSVDLNEELFSIPKSWKWIRFVDVGDWGAGATPNRSIAEYYGGKTPWFKSGELNGGYIKESEETVTELALQECSLRLDQPGDVLIAMYGATIGKVAILEVEATTNQAVCACTCFSQIYNKYLLLLLKAFKLYFIDNSAGAAQPNFSKIKIIETPAPLPPLAEQKRIVAKADQLMALCDTLDQQLQQSHQTHRQLNDSAIHHLLTAENTRDFDKTWKLICDNFGLLYNTEENVNKLRQAILQLAVQGKLVPQDPKDEPAEKLLEKIQAEKAKLIKEGKLKKQQPLPPIKDDEIPYPLPNSWQWVRLGDVCLKITDGFHNTPPKVSKGMPYILATHVKSDAIDWDNCYFVSEKDHKELWNKTCPEKGEILIVNIGAGCGIPAIIDVDFEFSFKNTAILKFVQTKLFNEYLFRYLLSIREIIYNETTQGGAQPFLSLKILNHILLPLPPLAEQKRIVAKVDKLMALCDQLQEQIESARTQAQQLTASTIHHLLAG